MSNPTNGEGAFPFTEDEMLQAFLLVEQPTVARRHARVAKDALTPEMDWAMSVQTLALLYIGSESARAKIDRLREQGDLPDREGEPTWAQRVAALRQSLGRGRQEPPERP
ncbi:MAG TPA: hypothetical protein VFH27_17465 [Longimicrobiaceae bacterium]|nr:hypothetical protein [Longimicrobiaceae bacterium]